MYLMSYLNYMSYVVWFIFKNDGLWFGCECIYFILFIGEGVEDLVS